MEGNFFRARRDELGLTQKQVADALGLTTSAISAWEIGVATPRDEIRLKVAEVYQVSLARLGKEIVEMAAAATK
jgi:transcriptional regulator with XRE-family HTH domain